MTTILADHTACSRIG